MGWINTTDTWLTESQSLSNAQLVANHFVATGWHPTAISALCGNMRHESSINPDIWEFGYGHSLDRGYGLVQWTPATKYIDWANGAGYEWDNGDSQLARIDYEVAQNIQWFNNPNAPEFNAYSFADFRSGAGLDVSTLTKMFMSKYEHPNWSAGMDSLSDRQAFANRCISELDWSGSGVVIVPPDPNNPPPDDNKNKKNQALIHMFLADTIHGWR